MPPRFDKVSDQIFRGGQPTPTDLKILADVYGIKRIISLDGNIGSKIAPLVNALNIEHIIIPISGDESKPLINFLKDSIDMLLKKQPVYIHCRHGSDRTGMAVAMYRTQVQGWDAVKALKEAKSYGFGDKLDPETEKLYTKAITDDDVNDVHDSFESAHDDLFFNYSNKITDVPGDDIVTNMRDWFNFGEVAPAFMPQQSFAPKDDVKFAPPDQILNNAPPEFRDPYYFMVSNEVPSSKRKRMLRRILLKELNVPAIGEYDNYEGIRGVGPMAGAGDSGGFAYTERGGVPGGVGISETGGFLNL